MEDLQEYVEILKAELEASKKREKARKVSCQFKSNKSVFGDPLRTVKKRSWEDNQIPNLKNVVSAIERTLKRRNSQMVVVLWTTDRGVSGYQRKAPGWGAIRLECRRYRYLVSVVVWLMLFTFMSLWGKGQESLFGTFCVQNIDVGAGQIHNLHKGMISYVTTNCGSRFFFG